MSLGAARIRVIDGWRGLAVLCVIVDHASAQGQFKGMWAHLGGLGVDIFFVLSGYIITLRFIKEQERSSTVSLQNFYVRRIFRILPVVVLYLSSLLLLSLVVNLTDFHKSELLGSLFFFRNYQYAAHPNGTYTTHFWSLSIEEHFYLLWPVLFLWLGNRRSLWVAIVGAISCASWRVYYLSHSDGWIGRMLPGNAGAMWRTDTRFDGLLLGCAVAIFLSHLPVRNFIWRNFPKESAIILAILVVLNVSNFPALSTYMLIGLMLAATLVIEDGLVHKWLESRALVWIGTISYSVYIWQQLFFMRPKGRAPLGRLNYFPMDVICVLFVSALSFYFVEMPCSNFGKRFLRPKSTRMEAAINN